MSFTLTPRSFSAFFRPLTLETQKPWANNPEMAAMETSLAWAAALAITSNEAPHKEIKRPDQLDMMTKPLGVEENRCAVEVVHLGCDPAVTLSPCDASRD